MGSHSFEPPNWQPASWAQWLFSVAHFPQSSSKFITNSVLHVCQGEAFGGESWKLMIKKGLHMLEHSLEGWTWKYPALSTLQFGRRPQIFHVKPGVLVEK